VLQPELAAAHQAPLFRLSALFLVLASAGLAALKWLDVAAAYGLGAAPEIRVRWKVFDNERETGEEIPGEHSPRLPEMHGDGYWMAVLKAPACPLQPVRVYVRKRGESPQIAGVERTW
jgi:hypothetical protein